MSYCSIQTFSSNIIEKIVELENMFTDWLR